MSAELPPGWAWAHLEELTPADAPIVYGIIQPGQHVDGGVPFVRPIDIQDDQVVITALPRTSREISARYSRSALEPGDVVFSIVGTIGKCLVVPPALTGANITQSSVRLRPTAALSSQFLVYLMRSPAVGAQIARLAFGNAVQRLNVDHVRKLSAPLPPLGEQRRIVAKLDDLRARSRRAREALDEVPALLDRLKQSVLAAAFRGDLTAAWREAHPDVEPASVLLERIRAERRRRWEEANPRKKYVEPAPVDASDLPPLPPTWTWTTLGSLVTGLEAGRSPQAGSRPANDDEFGVLKVSAVTWERFDPSQNKVMAAGDHPAPGTTVRRGDLLISRANTAELVGAVVLVPADHPNLMLSDKTLRIAYLPGVAPGFLLWALRSAPVRAVFEDDATGTSNSMRNLSQPKILSAPIPLPPFDEQTALTTAFQHLEATIRVCTAECGRAEAAVDALDQALLAKAFRGELVPQDPADEPASVLLDRLRASRPA